MQSEARTPMIVDLDGTLTPTDTLVESVIKLVRTDPSTLLRLPLWLMKGRPAFKDAIAVRSCLSVETLPYRDALLEYLRAEKQSGRRLVLATAAHRSVADSVSKHLGLFDDVLASDSNRNLKGRLKLHAIQQCVGKKFVYAGDSHADLPIWIAAEEAVLVAVPRRLAEHIRRSMPVEREFRRENRTPIVWVQALRIHQWLKNLLLFVPMLTAFSFLQAEKLGTMMMAFLAFSLAASATYLLNDILDLESDRAHPRKRLRPIASGKIPILHGIAAAGSFLAVGLALSLFVSQGFFVILLIYLALTSAYSWVLKQYVLIDVLMLSLLYTLRILAGSVAISVTPSSWLLTFSVFIFLSLALGKRCSELFLLEQAGKESARGRDYRVTDLVVLWPLGVGAALSAVVVFGLFISAPETQARYATPQLLWLVAIGLVYWLGRLWIKTSRGEMHDDPVIYAIKDRGSRMTVLAMLAAVLAAHFVGIGLSQ